MADQLDYLSSKAIFIINAPSKVLYRHIITSVYIYCITQLIGTNMTVQTATYIDKYNISRKILVLNGMPFYYSSGTSSCVGEVFLPFIDVTDGTAALGTYQQIKGAGYTLVDGVVSDDFVSKKSHGFLNKPTCAFAERHLNYSIKKTLERCYRNAEDRNEVGGRFFSDRCMIRSARLGGDFWKTYEGTEIINKLSTLYDCRIKNGSIDMHDTGIIFTHQKIPSLNQWLTAQGSKYSSQRYASNEKQLSKSMKSCTEIPIKCITERAEAIKILSKVIEVKLNTTIKIWPHYPTLQKSYSMERVMQKSHILFSVMHDFEKRCHKKLDKYDDKLRKLEQKALTRSIPKKISI